MSRIVVLCLLLSLADLSLGQSRRRRNYQVEWDSTNTFFQSKPSALNVRLGDTVDFLCPHANHSSSIEYNTLYLVSEIDYNLCFTENYQPLIRCDQPSGTKRQIFTLSISKYLPYPNLPEFADGGSYYFISTSSGEPTGINQTFDGLCRTRNLRLIIDVQKYYRRYAKNENVSYRMKLQKQVANGTDGAGLGSSSSRLSWSLVFVLVHGALVRLTR